MKYQYKEFVRSLFRLSPANKKLNRGLQDEVLDEKWNEKVLNTLLKDAIKKVPYYKKKYSYLLHEKNVSLDYFDVLKKGDIVNNEDEFVSTSYFKPFLHKTSTGGSTGISLNLYNSIFSLIYETVFIDYVFSKLEIREKLKLSILREIKPQRGIYDYSNNKLILSQYDLNLKNTKIYLELMKQYRVNCLHAYPSSVYILCKHIKELGNSVELPEIKGIITSSESITRHCKELVLNTFPGATLLDLYGQSEHSVMAYSINLGPYHFIHQYGKAEFLDTGIKNCNNKLYEIIGTGFGNRAMPLIRYSTDDYVEIDSYGNILSVIGRAQDFLVNTERELVPCIAQTSPNTLKNVINFQYYQSKIGEIEYRVVANSKFNKSDEKEIFEDLYSIFNGKIIPKVVVLDRINRLPSGKQKRLIQELDINKF